jgi:mono/diheme cytochrome c family protein
MRAGGLIAAFLLALGCTKKTPSEPRSLVEEGKSVYSTSCTACHNSNPRLDGSVGPAVYGSSSALVEARVMRAQYPAGYTPKRQTHLMVALPYLKDKIPALQAYLNAP